MQHFKTNVVSDFRVADINKGGEGAPLVPIFHKNLILQKNLDLPVGVLNIGGVSNITIIQNQNNFLGFDTGPGNGPLDLLVNNRLKISMDNNGYPWRTMYSKNLHGYPWISMEIHGHPWIYMDN